MAGKANRFFKKFARENGSAWAGIFGFWVHYYSEATDIGILVSLARRRAEKRHSHLLWERSRRVRAHCFLTGAPDAVNPVGSEGKLASDD